MSEIRQVPSALRGTWVMLFDSWFVPQTGHFPAMSMAWFKFDGAGKFTGAVALNNGSNNPQFAIEGVYVLTKNQEFGFINGTLHVKVDTAGERRFYLIKRSPTECDVLLREGSNDGGALPLIAGGRLKKVQTSALDWFFGGLG